jgi:hypothetical protein
VITNDLKQIAEAGVAAIVGTRNRDRVPEMVRGWGIRVLLDGRHLDVCIAECTGRSTLDNLADNHALALTVVIPTTYRALQFKGRVIEISAPFPEDLEQVERHREGFVSAVGSIGVPRHLAVRVFSVEEAVSPALVKLRLAVDEIFDQTPGPQAGSRL